MSAVALNFVGGIPFQLLYDGIKIAIRRSSKFRSNLINLQFTLDSLQSRIIEEIGENNVELNLPNNIIEGIETKMNEGVALVAVLSELRAWNIRIWGNCYNCIGPNFAEQLDELDRSLRSLLDQLELEQRRNVTRLLILATNARDKQDDLEKRQLDILKGQQEILGMLMEQQHAIGRIVSSSVQQVASSTRGGGTAPALGLVFQLLFDAVTQVKVKNEMVKRLLRRFKSTLNCLEPLIQEVAKSKRVLHLPEQEIEMFISEVENGVELIHKCSKVSKRMNYKKSKYTNKILHLDMSLQRLFFELKGQLERRLNEAMDSANSIEAVIKKIEGGADRQKNELKSESQSSVPQPGSFAIGLDILNDQGHRDMNNDTLVDSTRNVEVVKPINTKSSCEVPPSPAGGLDVLNLQGSMDMDSATSNIEAGVMNMEGREVDDSKKNMQKTKGVHLKGTLDSEINLEKIGLSGVEKIEGGGGSHDIKIAETEPLSPAVRYSLAVDHPLHLPPGAAVAAQPQSIVMTQYEDVVVSSMKAQWQKGKLIGQGTFGSVYLATNRETGALCAMKEIDLNPDDPKSAESIKQLEQEIKVLRTLNHPNIVQYYGSELIDDHFYIYLEYVHPGSINKYVRDHIGAMTESVVRNFTRHILYGLAYLHDTKTIHRDIKGANLLVDASGVVKLADFGMAKHLSAHSYNLSLKGSPYWMAPEVIKAVIQNDGDPNLALAVDIWSLGCTIIEMFTGKPPWSEFEGPQAMFKVLHRTPDIPERLSAEGKEFLGLCFRRNPKERPSAKKLLDHPFVRMSNDQNVSSYHRAFSLVNLMDKLNSPTDHIKQKLGRVLVGPRTSD